MGANHSKIKCFSRKIIFRLHHPKLTENEKPHYSCILLKSESSQNTGCENRKYDALKIMKRRHISISHQASRLV